MIKYIGNGVKKVLNLEIMKKYRCPRWEELPDIDLYMDQVLVVLERYLSIFKRDEGEKIITSTMINNYVKQKITLPPINKKYTRYHIAYLYIVCVLKSFMGLSEICDSIQVMLAGRHSAEAFNMFADEFNGALNEVFGEGRVIKEKPADDTGKLLRSATTVCANILYGRCLLAKEK